VQRGSSVTQRPGVLKIGQSSDFEDFDPYHNPQGDFAFYNQLYGSLLRDVDQPLEANAVPWLATNVTSAANGMYVDITLRPGVTFHDGTALDSNAIVANLQKVNNVVTGRDLYSVWHPILKGWKVLSPQSIRILWNAPIPKELAVAILTDWYIISPTLISQGEKAFSTQADGAGAWYLSEFRPNDITVLKQNPNFWNPALPHIGELQYIYYPDPTSMVDALEAGSLDMAYYLPTVDVASLSSKFNIVTSPHAFTYEVLMSCKPGRPFVNLAARQAMQYLVPRQRFVQQALYGLGTVAYVHVTQDSIGWEPKFNSTYSYDPDLAKKKFQALGMLGKAPIQILQLTGEFPAIGQLAEMMADEMNAIGLNATLLPVTYSVFAERFFGSEGGDFDMMTSFMGRCDRYPTQPAGTNAGLFPIANPLWPAGKPPASYTHAYEELQHALTPASQRYWALELMGADLYYCWDIAVASFGLQYGLVHGLTNVVDSRDDFIILDGATLT
jgi:ABC-type transport system substrate-binding protein